MMTTGVAQSLLWLFAFTALSPLAVLAQTEETVWRHPLIRVKSAPKTASDSVRVEFSVAVTNVNDRALTFLAMGVPDQPPNLPVFSVEYRRAGIWRGYMDHDSKVQPSNGIRDGELAASARVEGTISLPPDWERMRVGFGWMGDRKLSRNSWSEETSREEFAGKGQTTGARRKVQPPKIRMLSVSRHVNKDFRGTSVQIEVRNPHRAPIGYYGFMPSAFSPPLPAGTISPFGSRYELTYKGVTRVKDIMINCPVGGGRVELRPDAKAVYSVWAPVVDEWDSMRIGLRWITGEAGDGERIVWTKPFNRHLPSEETK